MVRRHTDVLCIEDNPGDARLLREALRESSRATFTLEHAQRLDEGLALLTTNSFDVLLLDLSLPDAEGFETFEQAYTVAGACTPIIVLTGRNDATLAVRAVQAGVQEYLVKGTVDGTLLTQAIFHAVERHELRRQLQDRERFLASLNDVTQTALRASDLDEMLHDVADRLVEVLDAAGCYVTLWDEREQSVILIASSNTIHRPLGCIDGVSDTDTITAYVLNAGEPQVIDTLHDTPYHETIVAQYAQRLIGLGVPMIADSRKLGAVFIVHERPHEYTPAEITRGQQASQLLALAIAKTSALAKEHKRRQELETLQQASMQLTSTLDTDAVLDDILKHALRLIDAKDTHIFFKTDDGLTLGAARWADSERRTPFATPRPGGLTDSVASTGRAIEVSDMNTHPLFEGTEWSGAIIGLPLQANERLLGVMNVAFEQPRNFDPHERRILHLLANQAAIALQNARLYETVQQMALTDPLTGLYNQRGFFALARQQQKVAERTDRNMALLYLDVDNLKQINDTFGHAAGDEALIATAHVLNETFRDSDIKARMGGDEFVVLMLDVREADVDIGIDATKRLQAHLDRYNEQAHDHPLSISVGIALWDPVAPRSFEELVAEADAAMYRAKCRRKQRQESEHPSLT